MGLFCRGLGNIFETRPSFITKYKNNISEKYLTTLYFIIFEYRMLLVNLLDLDWRKIGILDFSIFDGKPSYSRGTYLLKKDKLWPHTGEVII